MEICEAEKKYRMVLTLRSIVCLTSCRVGSLVLVHEALTGLGQRKQKIGYKLTSSPGNLPGSYE